jgi:cell division cycle 14
MKGKWNHPKLQQRPLVYYCDDSPDVLTNTAFLLASFLVVELGYSPEQAVDPFTQIAPSPFCPFRDATYHRSTFDLTILDCCQGLQTGINKGWFVPEEFSVEEFEDLYEPSIDMSIINDKFIAFRGPFDEDKVKDKLDCGSTPESYVEVFKEYGVSAVVRLSEPDAYDPKAFTSEGIRHYDLYFDDCSTPSDDIVAKFLDICDREHGRVAVHCLAGLGRTGTLIALHMMRTHNMSARECIGWLRVCRPGSVIGPQQHYLDARDGLTWHSNVPPAPVQKDPHPTAASRQVSEEMALQVRAALALRTDKA